MRAALPWLALAACSPAPLVIGPPPGGDQGTVIAIFERGTGGAREIVVLDPGSGSASHGFRDWMGADERVRITAIHYGERPSALRLAPGALRVSTEGCWGLAALPSAAPAEIFTAEVTGGQASGWTPVTTLDPSIAELRAGEDCDPCDELERMVQLELITLDAVCGASFAARAPDGSVLVGSEQGYTGEEGCLGPGKLFRVPPDPPARITRTVRISPRSTAPESAMAMTSTPSAGGYFDSSGDLWLAGEKGEVWRGRLESVGPPSHPFEVRVMELTRTMSPLAALTSSPSVTLSRFRWMAGTARAGLPIELFARSVEGAFEHYDGARWAVIHRSMRREGVFAHAGVAWIGPGEGVGVSILDAEIARYANAGLRLEPFASSSAERPTAVAVIPGAGTLAGTNLGALYRFDPESRTWSRYGSLATAAVIATIFPYGTGFIAAGTSGFAMWTMTPANPASLRTCSGVFAHSVRYAARLGDSAYLLAGPTRSNQPLLVVTVLRPRGG